MICCDRCKDRIPATRRVLINEDSFILIEGAQRIMAAHTSKRELCTECTAGLVEAIQRYILQENPT